MGAQKGSPRNTRRVSRHARSTMKGETPRPEHRATRRGIAPWSPSAREETPGHRTRVAEDTRAGGKLCARKPALAAAIAGRGQGQQERARIEGGESQGPNPITDIPPASRPRHPLKLKDCHPYQAPIASRCFDNANPK